MTIVDGYTCTWRTPALAVTGSAGVVHCLIGDKYGRNKDLSEV
ncbi:MAG TPA: hypothetical protein VF896_09265 [Anaerolineales bacterium]